MKNIKSMMLFALFLNLFQSGMAFAFQSEPAEGLIAKLEKCIDASPKDKNKFKLQEHQSGHSVAMKTSQNQWSWNDNSTDCLKYRKICLSEERQREYLNESISPNYISVEKDGDKACRFFTTEAFRAQKVSCESTRVAIYMDIDQDIVACVPRWNNINATNHLVNSKFTGRK